MTVFLISFVVVALAALAMALGVILRRPPITAGCGTTREAAGGCPVCGNRQEP